MNFALFLSLVLLVPASPAAELKVGDSAPPFTAKAQDGTPFALKSREGKWTVLYFYPKADTPGCTKQACAFRDQIEKIHALQAEVIGVSADTVEAQAAFAKKHHLTFPLLADADGKVIAFYGTKMPVVNLSKRWTFILDPNLIIRKIDKDVDPVRDADRTAAEIARLRAQSSP